MSGWLWIGLTLFAVVMQTLRTAAQKQLSEHMGPVATTLVRFVYGLPFALVFLATVLAISPEPLPAFNGVFWTFSLVASVAQVAATALLIYLFSLRNFAVGTTYARTEAFLTALVGATFFGEVISSGGWFAIVVSVAGVLLLTFARTGGASLVQCLTSRAAFIGVGSGLLFAITSLSLRRASLSFGLDNFLLTASLTLAVMVTVQTLLTTAWVVWREPGRLQALLIHWRPCLFVGLTSALGSFGWFCAMTLEQASYVKALGQIEFVFALLISALYFREKTLKLEFAGMMLVAAGILMLLYFG